MQVPGEPEKTLKFQSIFFQEPRVLIAQVCLP